MFGFFKKKPAAPSKIVRPEEHKHSGRVSPWPEGPIMIAREAVVSQPPNEAFPWPQGTVLTALDEMIIALPLGIFGKDEPMGSVVRGPVDMQINIPKDGDTFYIRLQPGMSVSMTRSCQARVEAADGRPRRFKIDATNVA